MSTTAGLTTQEYVAVNAAAIAAILLGLASAFALLSPTFLVIPLLAIVCAVIAWRQITHSNGTQGGKILAATGLVLALAAGGFKVSQEITQRMRAIPQERQIAAIARQMGQWVAAEDWDPLWNLFSDRFKTQRIKITREQFIQRWKDLQAPFRGRVRSIKWNGVSMVFQTDARSGFPAAICMVIVDLENATPWRQPVIFRKIGDRWLIDDMPEVFPPPPNRE